MFYGVRRLDAALPLPLRVPHLPALTQEGSDSCEGWGFVFSLAHKHFTSVLLLRFGFRPSLPFDFTLDY